MRRLSFYSLTRCSLTLTLVTIQMSSAADDKVKTVSSSDDKLVVTADRREEKLKRTIASTDIVTAEQVHERGYQPFVHDWLRGLPGVDVNQTGGGFAGETQIRLRGAKAGETRFMRDGIPITDATSLSGNPIVEFFDTSGISQVEVVRGAQSGLYGSGAIGGAVNMIGIRPTTNTQAVGQMDIGSFNTIAGTAQVTGPLGEHVGYAVGLNGMTSDGFSTATDATANGDPRNYEADGFKRIGSNARVEAHNQYGNVYLAGNISQARSELDSDYPPPTFTLDPNDAKAYQNFDSWRLAGGGKWTLAEHLSIKGDVAQTHTDRRYPNEAFYTKDFIADDTYASVQSTTQVLQQITAALGVDVLWQHAQLTDATDTTSIDRGSRLVGLWVSLTYDLPWLSLNAVGRHDDHDAFGGNDTWRLGGATFFFDQQYKIATSAGSGYRAPSLYELYDPTYGNAALQPQTSISADLGQTIAPHGTGLSLTNTGFITSYQDGITATAPTYVSVNLPSNARVYGIENALSWNAQWLSAGATYTWQDSDDGSGKRLDQLPDNKLMVDGTVRQFDAWLRLAVERIWSRASGGQILPPYTLVSAVAGYALNKHWDIYTRLENLTDEGYEIYPGYSTLGRAIYGGVRASF